MTKSRKKWIIFILLFSFGILGEVYTIKDVFKNQRFFLHLVSALATAFGGARLMEFRGYGKSPLYYMIVIGLLLPWTGSLINIVTVLLCLLAPYGTIEVDMPFKYDKKVEIDPYENLVIGLGIEGIARVEAPIQPVKDIFRYGTESERRNLLSKASDYDPVLHMTILRRGLDDKSYTLRTYSANLITDAEKICTRNINSIIDRPIDDLEIEYVYKVVEDTIKYIYAGIWDSRISGKIIDGIEKTFKNIEKKTEFTEQDEKQKARHMHLRSRLDFLKGDSSSSAQNLEKSLSEKDSYNLSVKDMLSIKFKEGRFDALYEDCRQLLKNGSDNYKLLEAASFFVHEYETDNSSVNRERL